MKEKKYVCRIKSEGLISDHFVSMNDLPCLSEADRCYSIEHSLSCQLRGKPFEVIEKKEI
ncbi:hypothetical protein prwr041_24820 [Prevotella herbatica]|uniref:Uncharacterized protein n=1 Tax=Prevotella herbatica TaxID=2801997 RepID=A0ABN6EKZ4_9BACT|nr:hypothetical protein prwr041_24820 [Prevotella herbatica]